MVDDEVAIIGAGLSGLGMGAALRHAGIEDFVICERAADVGGTWRDNTYPGVGVDIPTFACSSTTAASASSRRAVERRNRRFIAASVRDDELRRKLTPDYGFGCKRPSISNDYLRTFRRDNVSRPSRSSASPPAA